MASKHTIILSVIICLTFLNFLMWSKTNYGANSRNGVDQKLSEIQSKIDKILEEKPLNSEEFELLFSKLKKFSASQVTTRQKTLAGITTEKQYYLLYGSLAMEVFCPSKVRVGTIGDGGKWVCNPWKIPENSVLFSLGLNNFISFEEEWQKLTNNRSVMYGFDVDEQHSHTKETYSKLRGTTRKAKIANETDTSRDEYTIEDLVKISNVSEIEILKIDIEGAELTCLVPFLEKFKVCQIYLEGHGGAPDHAHLLNEIGQLGYRLFSYEVNGYSMSACEYSFIRDDCVEKYGAMPIANYLDYKI